MALENLVDGMSGLQMANTIKNNFDKVLDAESAENKAENAGKSIKTDYDATRYIELQLADGTPVKMKMDVFCQAIAPVVAEQIGYTNQEQLVPRVSISGGENLNNYRNQGIYRVSGSGAGYNAPGGYGILIVMVFNTSTCVQLFVTSVGQAHIRAYWSDGWSSWSAI